MNLFKSKHELHLPCKLLVIDDFFFEIFESIIGANI